MSSYNMARACSSSRCLLSCIGTLRTATNGFHVSIPLQHDPSFKKKKKMALDPKVVRKREKQEAKRRLEPIIIPTDPDCMADPVLFGSNRRRPPSNFSAEDLEERVLLSKEWSRYCFAAHKTELERLQIRAKSRQDALRELKKISIDLFDDAIKVNRDMFPFVLNGPVETPPCQDYIPPDLDDLTKRR